MKMRNIYKTLIKIIKRMMKKHREDLKKAY
jgi:hypothetical protein